MSGYFGGTWFGAYFPTPEEDEDEPTAVIQITLSLAGTEDTDPTATIPITLSIAGQAGVLSIFNRLVGLRSPRNPASKEVRP